MNNSSEEKDILLAEDDQDDVDIFKWAMEKTGVPHSVRHAHNGEVLFVLLKEKIPYILFLDIEMPCKDGLSCILEIRKNRDYDNLPVIVYSSYAYDKYVEDTYRSGANLYISKAGSIEHIVANLKKVFAIDWKKYMHYPCRDDFHLS